MRLKTRRWTAYLVFTAAILTIYSYPALRTARAIGSRRLPSMSAEDLGLYLSLSRVAKDVDGNFVEPYYHLRAPANGVGFFKFRLGPLLFGRLTDAFGGRMWPALFTWNLLCWGFLCLSAIWLFDRFLPRRPLPFVLAAASWLMLVDTNRLGPLLTGWRYLPSLVGFQSTELVYIRPFIPQFAVALLVCYLGLQMLALQKKGAAAWVAMAAVQFAAFAAFPYATLTMAGLTAVASAWYVLSGAQRSAWRTVLVYMLACALLDGIFLLHGQGGVRTGTPGQTSLLQFRPSLLHFMIGRLWIVMALLVAGTIVSRKLPPQLKWPLAGLGLATMLLVLGDAIVPERVLFLSDHAGYFVHPTIVILSAFLFAAHARERGPAATGLRLAALAGVGFCLVNGALQAEGGYRAYLNRNLAQADVTRWLAAGQVAPNDLVISTDDLCSWVPLASQAQLLFCRIAQCVLSPQQNLQVQRLREVLYLYFIGKDSRWLETSTQFERYGFYYELTAKGEDSNQSVALIRDQMRPFFGQIESGDPSLHQFFRQFRRIWIVQDTRTPMFQDAHLDTYLNLGDSEAVGNLVVVGASAR
jgi:hypothetical protein